MGDYPDYTDLVQLVGSDIMAPIDIQGAYIMLPVDIQAQYVTLEMDIVAQSIGNIAIDIAAQTVGNIGIDIKAQTLAQLNINLAASAITLNVNIQTSAVTLNVNITGSTTLDINIASQAAFNLNVNLAASAITLNIAIQSSAVTINMDIHAQSVGVYLQPEWATKEGQQKVFFKTGSTAAGGYQVLNYTVITGKTLYLTFVSFCIEPSATADGDKPQMGEVRIIDDGTDIFRIGGNGGGGLALPTPLKCASASFMEFQVYNNSNHVCYVTLTIGGYEI